ncbi:MAG: hypothetical protein AAGA27_03780 [Pseudomonadota bacterium]
MSIRLASSAHQSTISQVIHRLIKRQSKLDYFALHVIPCNGEITIFSSLPQFIQALLEIKGTDHFPAYCKSTYQKHYFWDFVAYYDIDCSAKARTLQKTAACYTGFICLNLLNPILSINLNS